MQILYQFTERSLLLRLGFAMAAITLLGIIGMASSIMIASMTQGSAITIDEAGSLRMQSYRIASLIMVAQKQESVENWNNVDKAIGQFEKTLNSRKLNQITATSSGVVKDNDYLVVVQEWKNSLKPKLVALVNRGRHASQADEKKQDFDLLQNIKIFVDKTDNLVKLLAQQAETRITLLTTILGISLYITLAVVFLTMYVMHADVLLPLRNLLTCAEKAGKGDFSERAQYTGEDELGRLGKAFNVMAEDLSKLYQKS